MAVPRVFISSTYYDMRQVRNNIGDFIRSLGYEAIMHENAGVTYTQNEPLERDCYHEIIGCDIVVCIIGNHFGTQSLDNDLSITMNEIQTAIKQRKKVYIFISNDVYIENRTYEQNKDSGKFKSAYTDDIKIHEFISALKADVKFNMISPFDTTDQIISALKQQFAGLFQNLLTRESSLTESKTAYDLQQSTEGIKAAIDEFKHEKDEFFEKFDSTIYALNGTLQTIKQILGIQHFSFFARTFDGVDEFLCSLGFTRKTENENFKYVRETFFDTKQTLILNSALFDSEGKLRTIRNKKELINLISWTEEDDSDLPF